MLRTHPFVRFLNQNRRQIRITIIVIVMFLLMLRFLNSLAEKKIEKQVAETNTYYIELANSNEHKKVIQNFLEFCVNGDESSAYALLSSECKENSFKTLNDFNSEYILKNFSENKNYSITYSTSSNEKYYYSVKISEDILSTGKVDGSSVIQSFSVVQENGVDKITIEIY